MRNIYIGAEHEKILDYIAIWFPQNPDFITTINQKEYIDNINEINIHQHEMSTTNLSKEETTFLRGALGKIN